MAVSPSTEASNVLQEVQEVWVVAMLNHAHRLGGTIDACGWGNGWGGAGGSFCNANGSVASFVGVYPDKLSSAAAHVGGHASVRTQGLLLPPPPTPHFLPARRPDSHATMMAWLRSA